MDDNIQLFNADDELERDSVSISIYDIAWDKGDITTNSATISCNVTFTFPTYTDGTKPSNSDGAWYYTYGDMTTNETVPDSYYSGLTVGTANSITLIASASYSIERTKHTCEYVRQDYVVVERRWFTQKPQGSSWYSTGERQIVDQKKIKADDSNKPSSPWVLTETIKDLDGNDAFYVYTLYGYEYEQRSYYDVYDWTSTTDTLNGSGEASAEITVYTHPGDCTIWSDLISGDRKKSELIKVDEVNEWLTHYKEWKSWNTQSNHYEDNVSSYIPTAGEQITAKWYNDLAGLVGASTVNAGDAISNSHFTALSSAIS